MWSDVEWLLTCNDHWLCQKTNIENSIFSKIINLKILMGSKNPYGSNALTPYTIEQFKFEAGQSKQNYQEVDHWHSKYYEYNYYMVNFVSFFLSVCLLWLSIKRVVVGAFEIPPLNATDAKKKYVGWNYFRYTVLGGQYVLTRNHPHSKTLRR